MLKTIATSCLLFTAATAYAQTAMVTVENPMRGSRTAGELAEVSLSVLPFTPDYATTEQGDTLPCQITYDGLVVFPCPALKGREKLRVTLHAGCGTPHPTQPRVYGRLYPERQMDFSFENDRIAYRVYGPETRRRGERLYGYDIFLKRTPEMILNTLYSRQCDSRMWATVSRLRSMGKRELADDVYQYGFCYHVDHGEGMDIYKVGPTLGAGAAALMHNGEMLFPWGFRSAELLDSGSLRLTVKLTGYPMALGNDSVTETRLLTIDAGSNMVKATVTYSGLTHIGDKSTNFCTGIAVHRENPEEYMTDRERGIVAYADLGDPDIYRKKDRAELDPQKGITFIGCIAPEAGDCRFVPLNKETGGATGHVMTMQRANETQTYYFGHAWSRNATAAITNMQQWTDYLHQYLEQLRHPLRIRVK